MKHYLIQKVPCLFNYIILLLILNSCTLEPCNHKYTYEDCSDYQIEWSEGFRQDSENIYDYKIEGNCVTITEGEVCFRCGSVIGFTQRQICGSFRLKNHTFCR